MMITMMLRMLCFDYAYNDQHDNDDRGDGHGEDDQDEEKGEYG